MALVRLLNVFRGSLQLEGGVTAEEFETASLVAATMFVNRQTSLALQKKNQSEHSTDAGASQYPSQTFGTPRSIFLVLVISLSRKAHFVNQVSRTFEERPRSPMNSRVVSEIMDAIGEKLPIQANLLDLASGSELSAERALPLRSRSISHTMKEMAAVAQSDAEISIMGSRAAV